MATRVLVVDDEPDLTFLLRVTLEGRGYEVIEATNGLEAVEAVHVHQPDLVVLDVLLPGVDGWGVLEALRGDRALAGLPVVMLTAISSDDEEIRAFKANVTAYVTKPFSRDQLLAAVERGLAMRPGATTGPARRSDPIRRPGEVDGSGLIGSLSDVAVTTPDPAGPTTADAALSPTTRAGSGSGAVDVLPATSFPATRATLATLAALADSVDDAVVGVDADARVVSWNAGAARITGYSRDEVLGRRMGEVVTTLDPDVVTRLRADAFAGKPIRYALVRCLRKDSTKVEVVMSVTPVPEVAPGGPAAWVIGRDMTTKRWAEARFRSLLEAAPDAVVIVDSRGRIEFVNTQTERQFGYSSQEILGRPVEMLIPERLRAGHRGHRADYFANPHPRPMGMGLALFGRRRDGSEFPVEISLSPVMTEDGVLISAAIRDVTERQALEHAHAQAEERFRQAFESAPVGMVLVSPEGDVLRLNAALARIIGVRDLAQAAAVLVDRIGGDAFAEWGGAFAELLSGERVNVTLEQVWHLPQGEKWVNFQAVLVRNADGTPATFIVQLEDVTDRKVAETNLRDAHAALVQSERLAAVGEMASVVSHEIRNPIGAITNALFLIRHALGVVPPEIERQLALAEREAANATSIAEDLVAFARPRQPQLQPITLSSVVREVLEVLPPPAGVEVGTDDLDETVLADRVHITELFANLVANAYDAMPDGGRLTLSARGEGDMATVDVVDTGQGVDPGMVERMFEPFATSKQHGTGLGLAIVQRIVDSHGGTISLRSAPGEGTTISLRLQRPRGKRVLVADDDAGVRTTSAEILRQAGFTVSEAADGAEALAALQATDVDLLLLDLRMPVADGWQVLAQLERSPSGARGRPVVVVATGETLDAPHEEALGRFGVPVLHKPVTPETLLHVVREALSLRQPVR